MCAECVCVCVFACMCLRMCARSKVFAWEIESKSPAILLQGNASVRHLFHFERWFVHRCKERWNGEKGGIDLG